LLSDMTFLLVPSYVRMVAPVVGKNN
jgi:hypothetical protein